MDDTTRRIIRAYYQGLAAPERRAYEELLALEPGARAERVAELLGLGWRMDDATRRAIEGLAAMDAGQAAELLAARAAAKARGGILGALGRLASAVAGRLRGWGWMRQ